jgi:hypothetical protein
MIPVAAGARIWIATGHIDVRKSMQDLALLVQEGRVDDGIGLSLYAKRLDRGRFGWPTSGPCGGADGSPDELSAGGDRPAKTATGGRRVPDTLL